MKYIDISEHQGVVDWDKLREQYDDGTLSGVIIRAGRGQKLDIYWERNIAEANRVGIPVGVYWFCEARTAAMAKAEAETCIKTIAPHRIELPVAYDFEEWTVEHCIKPYGVTPAKALITAMCDAACATLEKAGYYTMIYTNPNCMAKYQDMSVLGRYDLWLASWVSKPNLAKPPQKCGIWQWGGSVVPGIKGNVDTNEAYKDYAKIIRDAGGNHLGSADVSGGAPGSSSGAPGSSLPTEGKTVSAEDVAAAWADVKAYADKRFSGLLTDD